MEHDTGLFKNVPFNQRASLQLRAEFFNVFNNTNFGDPNNHVSGPLGTIAFTSPSYRLRTGSVGVED